MIVFLRHLLIAFAAAGIVLAAGLRPEIASAAADPAAKEAELKQVRSKIDSIRKSIQAEAERRDSLAASVRKADMEVQSARQRLSTVREQWQAAQARL